MYLREPMSRGRGKRPSVREALELRGLRRGGLCGAAASLLLAFLGCEGGSRPAAIVNDGGAGGEEVGGGAGSGPSWTFQTLDGADDTGWQPELQLDKEGKLAAVWFRATQREGRCQLEGRAEAATDIYEIVYAVEEEEGNFAQEIVTEVELVGKPTGLSLAFGPDGAPLVAFMGGEQGEFRCGATNSMLARRGAGGWEIELIDSDGDVPAMLFDEDVDHCAFYQNACNLGDVVGLWPALGIFEGAPILAYRDIHYGFGVDAEEKSDLQLYWRGNRVTAEAVSGAGNFTRLVVTEGERIHIAHYNDQHHVSDLTQDYIDGIWVIHFERGDWTRERVVPIRGVDERIGFASHGERLGLAWFDVKEGRLSFVERVEGEWSKPQIVDSRGRTGLSPSLAYDGQGRPVITYRSCGVGKAGTDCQAEDDRLLLAVRTDGGWTRSIIRAEAAKQEGLYSSLVVGSAGAPVVAFQESFFDPIEQVVRRRLVLARQGEDE